MSKYKFIFLFFPTIIMFSTALQAKILTNSTVVTGMTNNTYDNRLWKDGVYIGGAVNPDGSTVGRGGAFAININSSIKSITNSDFINNYSTSYGAGLESYGSVGSLENVQFIKNTSNSNAGGLANTLSSSKVGSMQNILFDSNTARGSGGAIFNSGSIGLIDSSLFIKNVSENRSGGGGAIYNNGGVNPASIKITNSSFDGNMAKFNGGAIFNNSIISLTNTSFVNNSSTSGLGGAIFNTTSANGSGNIIIKTDGVDVLFMGNTASGIKNDYYATLGTSNNFDLQNGNMYFDGSVTGEEGWNLKLSGNNGLITFDNKLENSNITLENISLSADSSNLVNNSMDMTSGIFNINNIGINDVKFRDFKLSYGTINMNNINVDLENKLMAKLSANNPLDITGGTINVGGLSVITDTENASTDVPFAALSWADKVAYNNQTILAPIFEYNSSYNSASGNFNFLRTDKINTAVQATTVGNLSNSVLMEEVYTRVLNNIDSPIVDHCTKGDEGKCENKRQGWIKPFYSQDDFDLKNFKVVQNEFSGIIFGVDSEKTQIGNGWDIVKSIYGAYVTGKQEYDSSEISQKGGYLGASIYAYKGNYFAGLTGNIGYMFNESKTMYGKDSYDTKLGGFALKNGFDLYLSKNTILQPSVYVSYSQISTDNYKSKANVDIESEVLHVYELAPELKIIQKLPNAFSISAETKYVKTYNSSGEVLANNILLPDISLKPFIEYGVGLQKGWHEETSKDIDSMLKILHRDGGREGWEYIAELHVSF